MPFNDRAIEKIFQQGNPTVFLFSNNNEPSDVAEKVFEEVAHAKKGVILFSVSKPNDGFGHYQKLADYVGANTAKAPAIMLVETGSELFKYRFDADVTANNLNKFIDDWKAGKLEKYMKSEEIPEKNDEPVKVIVGKTFHDLVINNNRDILLEFYAPWCGHCKALSPKYDAAAKKLAGNKNIVIAKIDATANEVPGVNIKGFPTIKFYPGDKKSSPPIDFEGEREEEGIIKWLKEKTTHPWVEVKEEKEDL